MWQFFFSAFTSFTMERMMSPGIANMLISVSDDLYPDEPEKAREMCANHTNFFNTQPTFGIIVPGVILGLEIERAKGGDIPNEMIQSIKSALAGPFAGIGDTLIQGMLCPILLSIAIGLSANGSVLGVIFLIVSYCAISYPMTYYMFKLGLNLGVNGAEMILTSSLKDRLMNAIQILGVTVVGAVTASTANVKTSLVINVNGVSIAVQNYMDQIFPGLLTLLAAFFVFWLVRKKKVGALKIMFFMLIASIIGYFTTIL